MRVLVCGGRDFEDAALLSGVLDQFPITVIIHGAQRGADMLADAYAKSRGIPVEPYPYLSQFGIRGGPMRNKQMLDEGKPELVVAFPTGGPGTANMMRLARAVGVEVLEVK